MLLTEILNSPYISSHEFSLELWSLSSSCLFKTSNFQILGDIPVMIAKKLSPVAYSFLKCKSLAQMLTPEGLPPDICLMKITGTDNSPQGPCDLNSPRLLNSSYP